MTLETTTNRVAYSGNGVTTAFSFPYYFLADEDLVVVSRVTATGVETTKTLTTHYTVSGEGDPAGGTVTMLVAPATGTKITIYRATAIEQDLDLEENGGMPADEIEQRFDKLTMICQRLSERLDRAVRLTEGFTDTFDLKLPELLEANTFLAVNSTADGLEMIPSATVAVTTTEIRSGSSSLAAAATSKAVAFSSDLPSTSYSICALLANYTDTSPAPLIQPLLVTAKAVSGFTVSWSEALDTANYVLEWFAMEQ